MTVKDMCIPFYEQWEWPKVSFYTFYRRMNENKNMDMAQAILPDWRKKQKFVGQYAKELEWRWNQPTPKANRQVFYGRIRLWYSKEEAMLTGDKWKEAMAKKERGDTTKKYIPTYSRLTEKKKEEKFNWIEITYSKEEAKFFRKELVNIIEDLEWRLRQTEEKEDTIKLNKQLENAQAELSCFNSYNPR